MAKVASRGKVKLTYNSSSSSSEDDDTEQKIADEKNNLTSPNDDAADESSNGEQSSADENSDSDGQQESGWADAISKVLQTKVTKKSFILSKAKKDRDIEIREKGTPRPQTIEIVG